MLSSRSRSLVLRAIPTRVRASFRVTQSRNHIPAQLNHMQQLHEVRFPWLVPMLSSQSDGSQTAALEAAEERDRFLPATPPLTPQLGKRDRPVSPEAPFERDGVFNSLLSLSKRFLRPSVFLALAIWAGTVVVILALAKLAGLSLQPAPRSAPDSTVSMIIIATEERNFLSLSNKMQYTRKYDYPLHLHLGLNGIPNLPTGTSAVWAKIPAVLDAFAKSDEREKLGLPRSEWAWILDLDSLITNMNVKLEGILPGFRDYAEAKSARLNLTGISHEELDKDVHVVVANDCNSINFGSVFFRNSDWSREFLARMFDYHLRNDTRDHEQGVFNNLLSRDFMDLKKRTMIVDQWLINAYPKEIWCQRDERPWQKGDFVWHIPGAWAYPIKGFEGSKMDNYRFYFNKYFPEIVY
ncbi:galactosyl transferase GMA12/MNN10 family-domain-containing protein [Hyaloraphidium curvatum]|nr:galactosyl transferase GMA12/MNN10 family-domain-containing protein [Hyaloraphidium curvatum]